MTSYFLSIFFSSGGMPLSQGFVCYLCAKQKMIHFKVKVEKKEDFYDVFLTKNIRLHNIEFSRTFQKFDAIIGNF